MMKVSVLYSDHTATSVAMSTATRQASEIDYAASMHFSAAYLPSGSSDSLDADAHPAHLVSTPDRFTATETDGVASHRRLTTHRL